MEAGAGFRRRKGHFHAQFRAAGAPGLHPCFDSSRVATELEEGLPGADAECDDRFGAYN